ncbi:hypothetical protein FVEN_g12795 [Fusarium venenatum]|nr:hypothetical protein FVEN_g12795 [Fusarium venenatum]
MTSINLFVAVDSPSSFQIYCRLELCEGSGMLLEKLFTHRIIVISIVTLKKDAG